MSNNAAERKSAPSPSAATTGTSQAPTKAAGAAAIYTLINTAKLNDVDPQAWLADVLTHIAHHPATHRRLVALELDAARASCRRRSLTDPKKTQPPVAITGFQLPTIPAGG